MKPSKKKTRQNKGALVLEFCVALPCFCLLLSLLIATLGLFALKAVVASESYALARAHLYGNSQSICKSRFLSNSKLLQLKYQCDFCGSIKANVSWKEKIILSQEYQLTQKDKKCLASL